MIHPVATTEEHQLVPRVLRRPRNVANEHPSPAEQMEYVPVGRILLEVHLAPASQHPDREIGRPPAECGPIHHLVGHPHPAGVFRLAPGGIRPPPGLGRRALRAVYQHELRRHPAVRGLDDARAGGQLGEPVVNGVLLGRGDQIGLVEHDHVGRHELSAHENPGSGITGEHADRLRVGQRHDRLESQPAEAHQIHDPSRVGGVVDLDQDVVGWIRAVAQARQSQDQLGHVRAARATVPQLDRPAADIRDPLAIEGRAPELVHHDGHAVRGAPRQDMVDERRLPGARAASDDGHRNGGAPRLLIADFVL